MHTVEYNCIQVHGAYSCVYMHTDAYTCVQTCTPQDFSSHFPSSSFSSSSLGLACHLSQNSFHPATVCNYASRCMLPHTGMLTSLSSLLSLLLLLSSSGVGGVMRALVSRLPLLVRILQVRHCNQHQHCCKHKHRRSEHRNSHNNKHGTSTAGSTRQTDDSLYSLFCVRLPNNAHTSARTARAMR